MSSNFNQSNPFSDHPQNPYSSPLVGPETGPPRNAIEAVKVKVMAPAIALIVIASLGLVLSLFNAGYALLGPAAPPVDPNMPDFVKGMQQGAVGVVAALIQSVFVVVNGIIIGGAVQMLRFKSRTLGIVSSVLAMVNFGTCCCAIGLPVGIWSLVVLLSDNVQRAFESTK